MAGGLSQSTVNDKAGARTPLALVFASIAVGLCLMFLSGLLANLPNVVLAAIVLVALFVDFVVLKKQGAHAVTVPGAVMGWHDLLARHGTMSLREVLADA